MLIMKWAFDAMLERERIQSSVALV